MMDRVDVAIASRFIAGDTIAHLAEDYGMSADLVEAALRRVFGEIWMRTAND